MKERQPCARRFSRAFWLNHIFTDDIRMRDLGESVDQKRVSDTFGRPLWIVFAELLDKFFHFRSYFRSALFPRFPSPVTFEKVTMPVDNGGRLNYGKAFLPAGIYPA